MFDILQNMIKKAESSGADFVDARYDSLTINEIVKENGNITRFKTSKRSGIGFNVYYHGATAYAFSADLTPDALEKSIISALKLAKDIAPLNQIKSEIDPQDPIKVNLIYNLKEPSWLAEPKEKLDLLARMESSAKENAQDIASLVARYGEFGGEKYFTNSEGTEIYWNPYLIDIDCQISLKHNGKLLMGGDGRGGSVGLEYFKQPGLTPEDFGKNAAVWANEKKQAKKTPAGENRALIDNFLGGVLAHESFGHLTEGDLVISKGSPLHDKIGKNLASDVVSIIDEGVMQVTESICPYFLPYDDQGTKTTKTVLLENGILKNFLNSRSTAKFVSGNLTGNSRAIDFTFAPIPRMKNTYFAPGNLKSEAEALEQLGTGIYVINTKGGQVDLSGDFMFNAARGYYVKNGEIQYPLSEVSLMGNVFDFLQNVEALTDELEIYSGYFGGCGKGGQAPLPVGLGGPKLVVNKVRFGGESK